MAQQRLDARSRDLDSHPQQDSRDPSRAPVGPVASDSACEVGDEVGRSVRGMADLEQVRSPRAGVASPVQDRAHADDEETGCLLDGGLVALRVPQEVETLGAAVVRTVARGHASLAASQEVVLDGQAADPLLEDGELEEEWPEPGEPGTPDAVALRDPAGNEEEGTEHPGTVRGVRGLAASNRTDRRDVRQPAPRVATGRRRRSRRALHTDRVAWTPVSPTSRLSLRSCADVQAGDSG
jgi:hypothetical protein